MFFADFRGAVLECLRARVKNGLSTERSLARTVGISQPHMHNVLKGQRSLSPELSDQILQSLHLSLLDLVDRDRLARHLMDSRPDSGKYLYLPVLKGRIGPGHPWPSEVEAYDRFWLPSASASGMVHPVIGRVGEDVRMSPHFADGDLVLLNQCSMARTKMEADGYYLIKRGRVGLIRQLRFRDRALYVLSSDVRSKPEAWERLPLENHPVTYYVRARATFIAREVEWNQP